MDVSDKVSSEEPIQTSEVENKSENELTNVTNLTEEDSVNSDNKDKVAESILDCGDISTNTSKDFGDNQKLDSFTSDHGVKLKPKPLESEPDQRNTSTSNAGESEYESANEEDLLEFEGADKDNELFNVPAADTASPVGDAKGNDNENNQIAVENAADTEDNKNFVSLEYEDSSSHEKGNDDKLSDNEKSDLVYDEEFLEDGSLDEESFNEGDIDDKLENDDTNFDSERENGDGEESEAQDPKTLKAVQAKLAKNAEAEDKRNPQYIPRKGPFYEHDDRLNEEDEDDNSVDESKATNKEDETDADKQKPKKKLLSSMKLCSDEIFDEQEADKVSKKSISSEKLDNCLTIKQVDESESSPVLLKADSKQGREFRKKPLWDSGDRWNHDKFVIDDQKPKTRDELISLYGYDIRSEVEAPKLQRRSKYGKGPQKYLRRSEDESAYAKKTLRKAIRGSNSAISENSDSKFDKPDFVESHKSDVKVDQVYENSNRFSAKDRNHNQERAMKEVSSNFTNHRMPENRVTIQNSRTKPILNSGKEFLKSKEPHNDMKADKVFGDQNNETKSKELFTNDDFPELVSTASNSPPKPTTVEIQQNSNDSKGRVIYYQVGTKNEPTINAKDHSQSNNTTTVGDLSKEPIRDDFDITKPSHYVPVVKSQLFENSRYSRNRMNLSNQDIKTNQNWNNNRSNKPNQTQYNLSQQHVKKQSVNINSENDQKHTMNDINDNISCNDSRPKRYSSIRQQRITTAPANNHLNSAALSSSVTQSTNSSSVSTLASTKSTTIQSQQYVNNNLNPDPVPSNIISSATKNNYYDLSAVAAANSNEISHSQGTNLMSTPTNHPSHSHNYVPINGASSGNSSYISTAPPPLMAYYDPTTATGQTPNATATGLQTQLGLTSAYFGADQSAATQAQQNYYLTTTDLTAVAYHPAAYHLPANYQPPLAAHHAPQSHVANRYLNTTPANAPSAESNRYLQTGPTNQTSAPLIVASGVANLSGQTYQQSAFPSGYPQFPPPAPTGTTSVIGPSPLPAGYPNVPLANSNSSSSAQQQTASGYPELYRGGITYYDIQSQQQAMQRQMQQSHRRPKGINESKHDNIDGGGDCGESSQSELAKQQLRPKTKFLPATN